MKKIPTMFVREFEGHGIKETLPVPADGCEEIAAGAGVATVKIDGACCAVINGEFYKRYDAKRGKKGNQKPIPSGAIKCQEQPDPVTGHLPCWVPCDRNDPSDKWFWKGYDDAVSAFGAPLPDGTYEAIGKHFQNNPYGLGFETIVPHGKLEVPLPDHSFDSIREYLRNADVEGLVFWEEGRPVCKIKRIDFGFEWPASRENAFLNIEPMLRLSCEEPER